MNRCTKLKQNKTINKNKMSALPWENNDSKKKRKYGTNDAAFHRERMKKKYQEKMKIIGKYNRTIKKQMEKNQGNSISGSNNSDSIGKDDTSSIVKEVGSGDSTENKKKRIVVNEDKNENEDKDTNTRNADADEDHDGRKRKKHKSDGFEQARLAAEKKAKLIKEREEEMKKKLEEKEKKSQERNVMKKRMQARTKKGQPFLKYRIESTLKKIEKGL